MDYFKDTVTQSIKLRASFVQAETFGMLKVKEVEFKLGLGPCGRHVTHLSYDIKDGLLTIIQGSRLPDELEPPDRSAYHTARDKLEADDHKRRLFEPQLVRMTQLERIIKDYRWGFWPIFEYVEVKATEAVLIGTLTDEQRSELVKIMDDYNTSVREWGAGYETKKFIYKISDIHGRIEVITN